MLVSTMLGDSAVIEYNDSKTHFLAYQKLAFNETMASRYIVVELANKSIVLQGTFRPGSIRWKDDYSIELADLPGTVTREENPDQYKKILPVKPYDH